MKNDRNWSGGNFWQKTWSEGQKMAQPRISAPSELDLPNDHYEDEIEI